MPFDNPFMAGLNSVQPAMVQQAPVLPPTPQNPFPGSGLTISQEPPSAAMKQQMDEQERSGAGNLKAKWDEYMRLKMEADRAFAAYGGGRMKAEDASKAIMAFQDYQAANRHWLEARPVQQQGNPFWNFLFGGRR